MDDEYSMGVVAPHNAQKSLIKSFVPNEVEVDTVERFQGGERDVVLMSATVSDPSYIEQEKDFLLNLNRLNVALSRMKKKLIVIVPETIFTYIPDDVKLYESSRIWAGLRDEVADEPDWNGSVGSFIGEDVTDKKQLQNVDVSVYTK